MRRFGLLPDHVSARRGWRSRLFLGRRLGNIRLHLRLHGDPLAPAVVPVPGGRPAVPDPVDRGRNDLLLRLDHLLLHRGQHAGHCRNAVPWRRWLGPCFVLCFWRNVHLRLRLLPEVPRLETERSRPRRHVDYRNLQPDSELRETRYDQRTLQRLSRIFPRIFYISVINAYVHAPPPLQYGTRS
ncbi:hypothetical protein L596_008071 [Steinernema carpocapsae]|uniref:Uncharacterized protein n=1 Tax=Steinernema carpocapsae TaxID=34508 RepID=A0A4U5PBF8_STECR|nr:hypothetical protein L596_008071 [Steinernema carpocapsae]